MKINLKRMLHRLFDAGCLKYFDYLSIIILYTQLIELILDIAISF